MCDAVWQEAGRVSDGLAWVPAWNSVHAAVPLLHIAGSCFPCRPESPVCGGRVGPGALRKSEQNIALLGGVVGARPAPSWAPAVCTS